MEPSRARSSLVALMVTLVALHSPSVIAADEPAVNNAEPAATKTADSAPAPVDEPTRLALPDSGAGTGVTSSFVARPESAPTRSVTQPTLSAAEAAARVRQLHGGRVLSVNASRLGDTLGYKVRVLVNGGRVKTVYVKSGSVSSEEATQSRSSLRQSKRSRSGVRTIGDG